MRLLSPSLHRVALTRASNRDPADEIRHKTRRWKFVDLPGRSDLHDLAVIHHADACCEGHGLFLIVGHHDEGHAELLLDIQQFELGAPAQLAIECAQRLVEQQQFWPLDEARANATRWRWPPES